MRNARAKAIRAATRKPAALEIVRYSFQPDARRRKVLWCGVPDAGDASTEGGLN